MHVSDISGRPLTEAEERRWECDTIRKMMAWYDGASEEERERAKHQMIAEAKARQAAK